MNKDQALEWFEMLIEPAHLERTRHLFELMIFLKQDFLYWIDWVLCEGGVASQIHKRTLLIDYDAFGNARYHQMTALCIEGQLVGINNERTWQEIESNGRFAESSKNPENQAIKAEVVAKECVSIRLQQFSEKDRVKLIQWRDQEVATFSASQLCRATPTTRQSGSGARL